MPALLERGMRVIDLSADYRLRNADVYAQWYGETHHDPGPPGPGGLRFAGDFTATRSAPPSLLANPGCYPQTGILGLAPLVAEKAIDLTNIIIDSKSGVSGAGRTPKLTTHFPECNESVSAYSVGEHRHTPEIEQALTDLAGEAVQVVFTPHLMPMDRGIFSTIYAVPRRSLSQGQAAGAVPRLLRPGPVRARRRSPAGDQGHAPTATSCDITVRVVRDRLVILVGRGQPGARSQRRGGAEFQLDVRPG